MKKSLVLLSTILILPMALDVMNVSAAVKGSFDPNEGFGNGGIWCKEVEFAINDDGKTLSLINVVSPEATSIVVPDEVECDEKTYTVTHIGRQDGSVIFHWGRSSLTSVTLPSTVTSIGRAAFVECPALTTLTINGCVTIEEGAISDCTALKSIKLPNNLVTIEEGAITGCSALTDITFPSSLRTIGEHAFSGSPLTSVFIPASVTYIGRGAFYSSTIKVDAANTVYDSREDCNAIIETQSGKLLIGCRNTVIPAGVKELSASAFASCTSLTNITLPEGLTTIGPNVFASCTSLTNITLPEGLTTIGQGAFWCCSSLTSIELPASLTTMERWVFVGCDALTTVTSKIRKPFELDAPFGRKVAKLIIPKGTREAYEEAGWTDFFDEIIEEAGDDLALEELEGDTETSFSDAITTESNLSNVVIDNVYYNITSADGNGYDAATGSIVLNTTTSDDDVEGIVGKGLDDISGAFNGLALLIPAGESTLSIIAATQGQAVLKVKIGSEAPQSFTTNGRDTVSIGCNVSEPTYVYIYAGTVSAAKGTRAVAAENSLLIYGLKWQEGTPTGIYQPHTVVLRSKEVYNINGQRREKPSKGMNLIRTGNGRVRKILIP